MSELPPQERPHTSAIPASRSASPSEFGRGLLIFAVGFLSMHVLYLTRAPLNEMNSVSAGDAALYHQMAVGLLDGTGFSHPMFGLRPPSFPALIAGVYGLGGVHPSLVVYFNIVLGALTGVLAYKLAIRLLRSQTAALIAGLLSALEIAHLDASADYWSEASHNAFLFAGLFALVLLIRRPRWLYALSSALLLSLALLARPITVYLPVMLFGLVMLIRPRLWRHAMLIVVICATTYLGWNYRNLHYADTFTFSTSGPYTLLFYKAVSVESHATGRNPEQVAIEVKTELEERLGLPYDAAAIAAYPIGQPEDFYLPNPERLAMQRTLAMERLTAYPFWTVVMTGVSFVRLFMPSPDFPFLRQSLQTLLLALMLLFAAAGAVAAWRSRSQRGWFLLLSTPIILYYSGLTAFSLAGLYDSRYRTPFMPFILMYTALGITSLARRILAIKSALKQPSS